MSERSKGACDKPVSMPATDKYRDGWDKIFGNKEVQKATQELTKAFTDSKKKKKC